MSKAGRPAKPGPRYPGGQLKPRAKPQGDPVNPIVLQRLFRDAAKLGVDQRLASQVGRLWCLREFTAMHAAAAFRIAGIYGRFERQHQKRRTIASPSYEMGYGRGSGLDDTDDGAEAESDFRDLQAAMEDLLDWRLRGAVEQLCVEDAAVSSLSLPNLRAFFERMANAWGMTGKAAKASRQERASKATRGPPLHFNEHETEAETPKPDQKPKPNIDRLYWIETMKRLRPDLDDKQLALAYDYTAALKDRAVRERQLDRRPDRVPLSQQYPTRLGKPVLTLPVKTKGSG